jgi:hypothetical protein
VTPKATGTTLSRPMSQPADGVKGRTGTLPDDEGHGLINWFVMVDLDDERTDEEIRAACEK